MDLKKKAFVPESVEDYDSNVPIDLTTPQVKPKRRSSFFNFSPADEVFSADMRKSSKEARNLKRQEYKEKLEKEKGDWLDIVAQATHRKRE